MLVDYVFDWIFVTLAVLHRVIFLIILMIFLFSHVDIIMTKGTIVGLKIILNFLIINVFIFVTCLWFLALGNLSILGSELVEYILFKILVIIG